MFTWMWTRKFARMANRVQDLEVTREENLFSSNLSVRTLETAPDFWQRQHQAFSYLDRQLQRMNRRTRVWGGMALLAILADAAIVVGGLAAFTTLQQHHAVHQVQQIAGGSDRLDDLMTSLGEIATDPSQPLSDRLEASRLLTYQLEQHGIVARLPQTATDRSIDPWMEMSPLQSQIMAIRSLAVQNSASAIGPLITLLNHSDPLIREEAARSLGELSALQAMQPMHNRLLVEESDAVRQALIGSLANLARRG